MSNLLCLVPVGGRPSDNTLESRPPVRIAIQAGKSGAVELWHDGKSLAPGSPPGQLPTDDSLATCRVAVLYAKQERESHDWYLVRHAEQLTLNGKTPAPLLARLEPGSLLAIGQQVWYVSRIWQPVPGPAPSAMADKNCPHCGGQLRLADVVQCLCGRYMHLERPDAKDDPEALNCYLQNSSCGNCGRATSLETQLIPEPADMLFDETGISDWPRQEQLA